MERTWILIGMMGSGKSTLGKALAEATTRHFRDTDTLLINRLGHSITRIFMLYGEDAFRDHETAVLRSLQPGNDVLATGGGIVLREENWAEMARLGTTVYLRVPIPVLKSRLERSKRKRPLLDHDDWEDRLETILESRKALYERAQLVVDVGDVDTDDAIQRVHQALLEYEKHHA